MGWIKLSDNKPPYGRYLVLYRNSLNEARYSIVTFCGVTRSIDSDDLIDTWYVEPSGGMRLSKSEITHWMELPQPPKGE
ncbi:DUF551 domain-containing protein [Xenorhabdus sp. BG5]|uniref:DUF551 domain-containing protein n=1 Tax=Xenorhabdus sp. BG5 TaxID=2782014 RepID=UPI00187F3E9E|nr:DUF551 domain-containing protein [Xenorhabdus sp. BG5]MBE8596818.1 DUF551 domain-containing protein [Xenorhabdus sp. BG5]